MKLFFRQLRVELAALYRIIAMLGYDDLIFTHITAKLPSGLFLINQYGMGFEEVTASSLLVINEEGEVVRGDGSTFNRAGFVIHSAIHSARPDAQCVIHTHEPHLVGVAAQEGGLLPLSQQATVVLARGLAYHSYQGIAVNEKERIDLQVNLGKNNNLILRNHGGLSVGSSVAAAFVNHYLLIESCKIQLFAQSGGSRLQYIDMTRLRSPEKAAKESVAGSKVPIEELTYRMMLRRLARFNPGWDQ
jgi:ribulose-5-phosphate 4-epimerase/fuculose-1-phosphate aldolase